MHIIFAMNRGTFSLIVLITLCFAFVSVAKADDVVVTETQCAPSVQLTMQERDALIGLNSRLSGLWRNYGKDSFDPTLKSLLKDQDPSAKVIEISPLFMEKILYIIDMYRLRHSIAKTIGLENKNWVEFERNMKGVMFHTGILHRKYGIFDKQVQKLLIETKTAAQRRTPILGLSKEKRQKVIDEAIMRIADMYITLQRLDIINRQVIDERAEDASRQMAVMAIGLIGGGAIVVSTIYAAPVVAGAGAAAATLSSDAVLSALLMRLGQVAAGAGLGIVGAPTGQVVTDSAITLLGASKNSKNFRTKYSCEIDKQMHAWKERGLKPYVNAAIAGGTIGFGGGLITMTGTLSARVLLLATTFGVGVAELYSVGKLSEYSMYALAEYRLAIQAMDRGDRDLALQHLYQSRVYAQRAGEVAVQGIIVTVLSVSIGAEFKGALIQGGAAIRAVFANSSDTLPISLQVAKEAVSAMTTER